MKKTMFFLLQALMLCGSVVCASDSEEVQKCYDYVGFPAFRIPCNNANLGKSDANQGESKPNQRKSDANQGRRSPKNRMENYGR